MTLRRRTGVRCYLEAVPARYGHAVSTETAGTDETPSPRFEAEDAASTEIRTSAVGSPDEGPDAATSDAPAAPGGGVTPSRRRRAAARDAEPVWRRRLVEGLLVTALSCGLAVLMTWPMAKTLSKTVPDEPSDPIYFAWQLAWVAHALVHQPLDLWTTPAFMGAEGNLAFTDTMLGYAPLGVLGSGMTGGIRMLNMATMLTFALAFAGAYALARALGARVPGAMVAGAGFAYAPWRMEQIIHLNILSTGGMALALAFLVRGHGWSLRYGLRPETRSTGFVVAGWVVATWQITLGFGIGVVFGYVLGGSVALLAAGWLLRARYRRLLTRRFVLADVLGALAFLATAALLAIPYQRVIEAHPEAKRTPDWLPMFSPPPKGFLIAPDTNNFWGARQTEWRSTLGWEHEMVVAPGVILMLLAFAGVFLSAWPLRRRLAVAAFTLVSAVLAMGTAFPWASGKYTFMIAYNHLPGWNSMRTPGRLVIWTTLALCLLVAGLVSAMMDRVAPLPERGILARHPVVAASEAQDPDDARLDVFGERVEAAYAAGLPPSRGKRAVWPLVAYAVVPLLALPAMAVVWEGRSTVTQWELYRPPVPLADLPEPTFVLPTSQVGDYDTMLWAADGWPKIANGDSGFYPNFQVELQARTASFPDEASIAYLRAKGVKSVLVIDYNVADTPLMAALDKPLDGLDVTRHPAGQGAVWYDLR